MISQSSSQNDICFVVPFAVAKSTVEALRREFRQDLVHENVEHITIDSTIAIVAVVGEGCAAYPESLGELSAPLAVRVSASSRSLRAPPSATFASRVADKI